MSYEIDENHPTQPLPLVDIPEPRWPTIDLDCEPRLTLLLRVLDGLRHLH
ncbi:hypothetical protein FHX69_7386 [Prauserella muralis]|nr:hypothetical protein FHX69_7386 [Prauserella muralis]